MTLSPFVTINKGKNKTGFKKRYRSLHKQIKLHYGSFGLIFQKQLYLELSVLKFLKKQFKFFLKKKKNKYFFKKKNWLFLTPNFLLTKKSKNSRMGKGKGAPHRWVINIKNGATFFETKNISTYRLNVIKKKLSIKLNAKLFLINSKVISASNLCNNTNKLWYF